MTANVDAVHSAMWVFAREPEKSLDARFDSAARQSPGGLIALDLGAAPEAAPAVTDAITNR